MTGQDSYARITRVQPKGQAGLYPSILEEGGNVPLNFSIFILCEWMRVARVRLCRGRGVDGVPYNRAIGGVANRRETFRDLCRKKICIFLQQWSSLGMVSSFA